jgi:hypothetical protein
MQNMKSLRSTLFAAFAVMLLAAVAYAQSAVTASEVQKSEVQKSFEALKSLAGSWEGPITVNPLMPGMNEQPIKPMRVTMRVTSRGNAIVHEFQEANTPLDPSRYDHPVTMLYVDAGQLNLVHYCDAGNRPHMTGKVSPDGKTVEFDFADLSGGNQHGHMHHAVFTFIDADHHTEEWTYMMPGDKPLHARMELHRVK